MTRNCSNFILISFYTLRIILIFWSGILRIIPSVTNPYFAMKNNKTRLLLTIAGIFLLFVGMLPPGNSLTAYIQLVGYSGFSLVINRLLMLIVSIFCVSCKECRRWTLSNVLYIFFFGFFYFLTLFSPSLHSLSLSAFGIQTLGS